MEATIIFDSYLPEALRQARDYAGDDGFVASLPQLLHARANAEYDNIIWNTWFTTNSEESVVTTAQGNRVVVTVHGGGIYATPDRFERLYRADQNRSNSEGFTGTYAGKISEHEARDVLEGKLPDGAEIPVFPYDEFKRGIANLPWCYGVIMDFDLARNSKKGYQPFEVLKEEPNMIVRAGGVEAAAAYLDKRQARHNTKVTGNFHPFDHINPDQLQCRVPFLSGNKGGVGSEADYSDYGFDAEYGIGGFACMLNTARYVAVAPRNESTSVRYLPFNTSSQAPA
jgi:hypothetical protein